MLSKWMDLAVKMALNAVKTIRIIEQGHQEIDIKRYCRIEKVFILFLCIQFLS